MKNPIIIESIAAIIQYEKWFLNNISEEDVILDIGCNTGGMPKILSEKAKFVYGIEIESIHIEKARLVNSASNIEFICADAISFDYKILNHKIKKISFVYQLLKNN